MDEIISTRMKVLQFIKRNPGVFTKEQERFILDCTTVKTSDYIVIPDLTREVYDILDLLPPDKNVYNAFLNLLDEKFDIKNKKIVEVGGGVLARLGEKISCMQDKGTITVYDPRLSPKKRETAHFKLKRKMFDRKTVITDADLIIGFMPCKGAEPLIDAAIAQGVDFMVGLCEGGWHGDEFDYFESDEEWRHCIISSAKAGVQEQNMGKLRVVYQKEYGNPYPIIYNERKSVK